MFQFEAPSSARWLTSTGWTWSMLPPPNQEGLFIRVGHPRRGSGERASPAPCHAFLGPYIFLRVGTAILITCRLSTPFSSFPGRNLHTQGHGIPNFPIWKNVCFCWVFSLVWFFNNCLVFNNWCLERVHANAGCDSSSLTRWALSLQGICSCHALRPQTPSKAGSSNSKAQHLCHEDEWQTHWIFATVDESEHVGMLQTVMVV